MGLAWSSGSYPWANLHVAVPFSLGLLLLVLFGIYGKQKLTSVIRCLTDQQQNGGGDPTASAHTFSSNPAETFRSPSLPALLRVGFITVR
jgi:hypothetical protein